ncbi:protein TPX2-like isoform X1 [Pyrus x bretschneideri]|uniref:protein TPX2-like isoform X1 n=2 Tax=Pyrus x bretschneideri TaxID=225117 RepID=UPI00202FC6F8|nr:protein TPX2-like isoform X1 [Pyrus x bretschneideri]
MEMEEDMEVEQVLMAQEVDIDYEYDAARYFDFARQETPAEARRAELWFESAKSYPPSPVVTRLILGLETLLENVNASPKSYAETANDGNCDIGVGTEPCAMDVNSRAEGMNRGIFGNLQKVLNQPNGAGTGVTFNSYLNGDKLKGKSNTSVKPSFPRSSTLMKPTASQLAKQNLKSQNGGSRFQMLHVQNNEKSLCSSSGVGSQAPKRQKLDGGHLHKHTDAKEQTNFVHKVPKKDETFDKTTVHARLRLTIPREPDFETAHRAHRIRPNNGSMLEQVTSTHRKFKARPLNRKIFEAPSLPLPTRSTPKLPEFQEFHLKTMERAMQNASAVSSSSHHLNDHGKDLEKPSISTVVENRKGESRRPSTVECPKQDRNTGMQTFKARPLNKMIFSSKGDIGVFCNSKRETTVPMEFNFLTDRRVQQFPPTDLFSKLSLTTELQQNNGSSVKLSQPTSLSTKDSKENRSTFFQQERKIKEKPSLFGGKQAQDRCTTDADKKLRMRRLGVR